MSETTRQNRNGLSAIERLRATDKYLTEMRGILASMDEIAVLRQQRGEAASDEFGGYRRSSVEEFIRELEKQKEALLAEIAEEGGEGAAVVSSPENGEIAKEDAVSNFQKGDISLVLESMYTSLSYDIEKLRNDILQEMKYTYKQDIAIYDDLSARLDTIKSLESTEILSGGLAELEKKIKAMQAPDYDTIAARVAEKMSDGIDYDRLAERIVAVMASGRVEVAGKSGETAGLERKIDAIKAAFDGTVNTRQMADFRKLDALISEYLRTMSYDTIPDLLTAANEIKDAANRYILSGNVLRGEAMLTDLQARLMRVNVWGSDAIAVVTDAIREHGLPITYSEAAFAAFGEAVKNFEQASVYVEDDVTNEVLRTKRAMFCDTEQDALDRDTYAEFLQVRQGMQGREATKEEIEDLTQLKKELMTFNLTYFIDFTPAMYEEKESVPNVDTQQILEAISKIRNADERSELVAEERTAVSMESLPKSKTGPQIKKQRQLRPAITAKDNKVEKVGQPLLVVHRKIDVSTGEDALSKQIVQELAQKIAATRLK